MKKANLPLLSLDSKKSTIALPAKFVDTKINKAVIAQYVRAYLNNNRQGTASTKDRSQVVATTKKMYKQKGTGNARHGSAKAPIFVGGGVAGGPKPRDYSVSMNKKQKNLAMSSVFMSRVSDENIFVISQDVSKVSPKTSEFVKFLTDHQLVGKGMLVLDPKEDKNLELSAQNIAEIEVVHIQNVNPYQLLKGKNVMFSEIAFSQFSK